MRYIKPQSTAKTLRRSKAMLINLGQTVTSATIRSNGEKAEPYPLKALKGRLMREIHSPNSSRSDYYQEADGSVTMLAHGNCTIKLSF